MQIERYNVLGVAISALTLNDAVCALLAAVQSRQKGYVCFAESNVICHAQRDSDYRRILNSSLLTTPDGMPLVWLGRRLANSRVSRVYGPDTLLAMMQATRDGQHAHYFYGGAEGVAETLREEMQRRFPGVRIVAAECPPFRTLTAVEEAELCQRVAASGASFLWVGLGAPKQERFMAAMVGRLEVPIMLGVGAAFDFHTGRVRQAPSWVRRCGLEWAFRLAMEPRRLARRYLVNLPLFSALVFLQLTGLRRFPLDAT